MKIPGNQPIFYLWPIQKLLHLGIPNRIYMYNNTSNLWGKYPLKGGNGTSRLISWEIHYRPLRSYYCLCGIDSCESAYKTLSANYSGTLECDHPDNLTTLLIGPHFDRPV